MVKLRLHADPDAGILRLIHDLRNALDPKFYAVVQRHVKDIGYHPLYVLRADRCAFYRGVQIHGGAGI